MTAEGPANKLAHCASDFAAGSRTPVHTQEKLNSTILLFDLGQSLGAASLIFFLSLIKRGFYVLEILLWNFSQWTFFFFFFLIGSGKFFESH